MRSRKKTMDNTHVAAILGWASVRKKRLHDHTSYAQYCLPSPSLQPSPNFLGQGFFAVSEGPPFWVPSPWQGEGIEGLASREISILVYSLPKEEMTTVRGTLGHTAVHPY